MQQNIKNILQSEVLLVIKCCLACLSDYNGSIFHLVSSLQTCREDKITTTSSIYIKIRYPVSDLRTDVWPL